MNITEKLKINNELFGEKNKNKNKTKKQTKKKKHKEQWIILIQLFSFYPRTFLLKLPFITETFTVGKVYPL